MFNFFKPDVNKILDSFNTVLSKLDKAHMYHTEQMVKARAVKEFHDIEALRAFKVFNKLQDLIA